MLLHFIWNSIAFILALGILIIIHELGHFLAARLLKIKVKRLSIGFGPILWKWHDSNGTEYVISSIFLGGYVKLYDIQKHIKITDSQLKNNMCIYQYAWKKSIIVLFGPISNFLFSILLYILIFMIGMPTYKPIISSFLSNSIIAQSDLPIGSEIHSINNIPTTDWESVRLQLYNNINKENITISTKSLNNAYLTTYNVHLTHHWVNQVTHYAQDPITALGIIPLRSCIIPILSAIKPNSIADKIGLKIGDQILTINEQPIYSWESFITIIKNNSKKNNKILVKRETQTFNYNLPLLNSNKNNSHIIEEIIGISPTIIDSPIRYYTTHWYEPHLTVIYAIHKTWQMISYISQILFKLISSLNISLNNLGGPLSIAQGAGKSAQSGLVYYLMFLALISINLGIINLLPLPILDGGHLLFLLIEIIIGKPLSKKTQEIGYSVGLSILILITCITFFNDITKLK